ncbi:styrene monooxygenase/indole monooxygenase family protein [Crossiella cryophila]|uniref:2-polyprenyl-6-methoxyphenol hydroxylase-like FAD-dependent oxidoreductase n=1 Tax=Crossiella cryophila TaxID=43355 RepID=A0A7W7CIH6_9PSEU|nr:styrene monooxygenase/indole monooxygenase family protein [Crossiella cryophila]MBB4680358.1 2-polyprenyl-6-methoxyphenol hydroxylase-like FAD-dependent oxidoreductase [Crossiella cryophila]
MRRIVIIGAGQAGLVLGLGLLRHGYAVTVVAERAAAEVLAGRLVSNQCVFHPALVRERELGINFWDERAIPVETVSFTAPGMSWQAPLDQPAQSVDQRVKVADWMTEFARRGGELRLHRVTPDDLEPYAREFDLVVVAAGRGPQFDRLFPRNPEFSPHTQPQRSIGVLYVRGGTPPPGLSFALGPHGECFGLPILSVDGPVYGAGIFAVPGGPLDRWDDIADVDAHLVRAQQLMREHFPWQGGILDGTEPAGPLEFLHGGITPVVRQPVGTLPSGALVLAMGDAAVTNDPLSGQGANMAAHAARSYEEAIVAQGDRPFDAEFMHGAFARYWARAAHATRFSLDLLDPPPAHIMSTLDTAQRVPEVAHRFAQLFANPVDYTGWLTEETAALDYLAAASARAADQ